MTGSGEELLSSSSSSSSSAWRCRARRSLLWSSPGARYALGLCCIFSMDAVWTCSSVLAQYLYEDLMFDSPFFMTYLGMGTFALLIPAHYSSSLCSSMPLSASANQTTVSADTDVSKCNADDKNNKGKQSKNSHDDDDDDENASHYHNITTLSRKEIGTKGSDEVGDGIFVVETTAPASSSPPSRRRWDHRDHFVAAAKIAPVMFLANACFNTALSLTSVSSVMVLVSTANIFAFVFAVASGDERYGAAKLAGAALAVLGTSFTAVHDYKYNDGDDHRKDGDHNNDDDVDVDDYSAVAGDVLAIVAAAAYAGYAVMVRVTCPRDEDAYSMLLLLGYVGVIVLILAFPAACLLWDRADMSLLVFSLVCLRGTLEYVVSENLYLRAVLLTTATVATVGLGLVIPMAFLADCVTASAKQQQQGEQEQNDRGRVVVSIWSVAGAITVSAGFLIVSLVTNNDDDDDNNNVNEHRGPGIGCHEGTMHRQKQTRGAKKKRRDPFVRPTDDE